KQAELRLSALAADRGAPGFDAGACPRAADVSLPFDPLPWLRRFVEKRGAALPVGTVRTLVPPPARLLRRGEAGFARAREPGADIARLPREAHPLVQFLAAVGSLGTNTDDERRVLRRKLAQLHPDKHPHATASERARLQARFHEVATA